VETLSLSRSGRRYSPPGGRARGRKLLGLSLLAFAALALGPAPASAMGNPFTQNRVQVLGGPRGGSDQLNFGLGLKVGYTLPMDLYIGGTFDYFFGEHDESILNDNYYEYDFSFWLLSPEVGYDFGVTPAFMVRPFGGIGLAAVNGESCSRGPDINICNDFSDSDVGLTLGGLVSYSVGSVFFGGELRFLLYEDEALVLGAHVGGAF
jgi:opacity protein-like surface antigen